MNINSKLKWGIIGAGIIAHKMAEALKINPDSELVAVASKTSSKAQQFARQHGIKHAYSYQEIVNSDAIDVIYVATTHNFHYENTKLALKHGKHVLVEKPFTVNATQARELVRLARRKHLFLMEAMWVRFLPSLKKLKTILANHEIGELKLIDLSFGVIISPEYAGRLKDPALAGGVTLDIGIYPISFACYLLDELPTSIKSMARFSARGVDELASYLFRFPSGCLTTIKTSYNVQMKNEALIYGSEGYIEFPQFQTGEHFTVFKHEGNNEVKSKTEVHEKNHPNGFIYQVEEVVQSIRAGKTESHIIPLDETVAIMEIMDTMRKEWGFRYPFE